MNDCASRRGLLLLAVLGTSVLTACASTPRDPLAELLERHTAARGGSHAIEAIRNLRTQVEIAEQGTTITGDYRATAEHMRIDVRVGGERVFSEGVDARGSWQQDGAGAPLRETRPEGEAALRHGIEFNLFGLQQLAGRGHRLRLEPDEILDGVGYRVVHVRLADGFETWLYVNPANWMIERRRDVRALHPDAEPTAILIESRFTDFRPMCGALFAGASSQVDARTGALLQTTRTLAQECNLPDSQLALPREAAVD
jgi:hypothetical protein